MTNGYEYPDEWGSVSDIDKERIATFKRRHSAKSKSTEDSVDDEGNFKTLPFVDDNNSDETEVESVDTDVSDEIKVTSTTQRYAEAVAKYAKFLDRTTGKTLFEADNDDFRDHLEFIVESGYSPSYFKIQWSAISQFYQTMNEYADNGVPENPLDSVDITGYSLDKGKSKKEAALDDDDDNAGYYLKPKEVAQMIEKVPKPKLRNELILKILFSTGIRRGECASIKLSHLDQEDCSIEIPGQKSYDRTVFYPESLNILINQWININRKSCIKSEESEYLLLSNRRRKLKPEAINWVVKNSAENAGLQETLYVDSIGRERKKITCHSARHGFAVESILNGIDIENLRDILGHSSLSQTQKYLRMAKEERGEVVRSKGAGTSLAQFEN